MPYDPLKDGMRQTAKGASIPHVSYRDPTADMAAPTAPAKKRRRPQGARSILPQSAAPASQEPVSTAERPALSPPPRRAARRRRPSRFPWKPVLIVVAIAPAIAATMLIIYHFATLTPAASTSESDEAAVIYVTATSIPNLAQTATSVLPPGYIDSLSQTPGGPAPSATALPSVTPAFVQPTQLSTQAAPVFTLGSSKIVYVCNVDTRRDGFDEICIMNADGSNQLRLTYLDGTDYYPSLSPDGRVVVFSSQRGNGPFNIYGVPAIGGDVWRITNTPCQDYAPEISPDGSRIVFASTRGSNGSCADDQNIWLVNVDGSNAVQITFDASNEIDPSWSPDGSMISFTSNRKGTNELFIMNADGSNVRQVTTGMSIGGRNDWSPDGRWLTFYAGLPTKEIYLVPIECAQLVVGCDRSLIRRLTDGGDNKGPSFSPDGLWITYTSGITDAENEIMIMRIDGSEVTRLTDNNTSDWQPRWGW